MRKWLLAGACLIGSLGAALAQTYPIRPITMIVVFAPGGPTDFWPASSQTTWAGP